MDATEQADGRQGASKACVSIYYFAFSRKNAKP